MHWSEKIIIIISMKRLGFFKNFVVKIYKITINVNIKYSNILITEKSIYNILMMLGNSYQR